jgi:NAD(P)-dependent dehydrogenase (short-subunit alcohol dehydrogenase family)
MSDQKVVLITGASSGVGQSTARLLSQKGYKVFGTSRNPASAEAIPAVEMYDPWRRRAFTAIRDKEEKGPGPLLVAETILKIISSKTPRLHYLIGSQARFVSRLQWFLPEGAYERAKMGNFGLGK